jgi:predicted lipid-binding transport protein (Tim44 family)
MPAAEALPTPAPADAPVPTAATAASQPHATGERTSGAPNVAAHPRASRRVAESKAWGGLAGFALGGYLSLAHHTLAEAIFRGLLTGIVCYVVVWAAAVFLWRRLVIAELSQAEQALIAGELERRGAQPHAPGKQGQ